ncbi:cordon-bleu protein-like 1 isoform X2 [Watersipora subatra]|uniref:cordon-bleu protein-like 1 isoform X2 n=1 Tax=Watersipora subatra TaxID=2589382 RepID=UPI00355B7D71
MNDVVDGKITLSIVLPDRQVKEMRVKYNLPMMDLLVQVASRNRLKPGEHAISVISEETGRTIDYQSSQTIGSLAVNKIFLINKSMQKKQRESEIQRHKDASKFEPTVRITVNMPRGVKSVQRLNPNSPIMDIFRKICLEKNLDPSRYEVRLTKQPNTAVDMSLSLTTYKTSEITIVPCSVPAYHTSMVDISRLGAPTLSRDSGKMSEPLDKVKRKKGLFSFLRKDKNKSAIEELGRDDIDTPKAWKKVDEARSRPLQTVSQNGDPVTSRKPQAQVKPQPKLQATIYEDSELDDISRNKAKRASSKKKYRAPPPPSRPLSTMDTIGEEKRVVQYASTPNLASTPTNYRVNADRKVSKPFQNKGKLAGVSADVQQHSRNSSDSSGYHEPPVTPESASSPSTSDTSTLPRQSKRVTATESITAKKPPVTVSVQRSQTLPGHAAAIKKPTKKKAAPPPPASFLGNTAGVKAPAAPTTTLTLHDRIVESEDETSSLNSTNVPLTNRSESRCSRASVDTIDDVQQHFDLAIAAGERELRHEQGTVSPASLDGAAELQASSKHTEVLKLTEELATLTDKLKDDEKSKPSQEEMDEAVAQINRSLGEDDNSDGSLVPDGENFVVAASKLPSGGKINDAIRSTQSQSVYAKPLEEISYGEVLRFDNPFRTAVQAECTDSTEPTRLARSNSQISDSTLPDSEHTDRPQSSSLQSSSLHSDEESATETGDADETASIGKVTQAETSASFVATAGGLTSSKGKRGTFQEVKGQDMNKTIYGELSKGSVRGIPGQDTAGPQVKTRAASFTSNKPAVNSITTSDTKRTDQPRPKSVFSILSAKPSIVESARTLPVTASTARPDSTATESVSVPKEVSTTSVLYSRPLPVYNRMNHNKAPTQSPTQTPTTSKPKALASVIADSVKSGDAAKPMRKMPETGTKSMFFKAARSSRVDLPDLDKIENVVKLDTCKYEKKQVAASQADVKVDKTLETKSPPSTAPKPNKTGASLARKESLKEQYNKLQENMSKWQGKLKDNESRVKQLTTSQQNLVNTGLAREAKPPLAGKMVKSTSASTVLSSRSSTSGESSQQETSEFQKPQRDQVKLRSAASRVIAKAEPELDPVESLMKSIRTRAGRVSDSAPDRGIYVATGESEPVPQAISTREVAPTVTSASRSADLRTSADQSNQSKLLNGGSKGDDSRFNHSSSSRDSLLAETSTAAGRPNRRPPPESSSSQSSSDELNEIKVRHKPHKMNRHKNSKRSISDPFPPQGPGSNRHIQEGKNGKELNPTPTELDPREELMIAIRTSGGLSKLRQVNADEVKWSVQV